VPVAALTTPNLLNWNSLFGKAYQVWSTTNPSVPFTAFSSLVAANGPSLTNTNDATDLARYFNIQLFP